MQDKKGPALRGLFFETQKMMSRPGSRRSNIEFEGNRKLVFCRLLILTALVLVASCSSSPAIPALDAASLAGRWQNRSGGFFRLSWDQCEFFQDKTFSCTSYPLKDDLVLTYDGIWSLTGNQLQLQLGRDESYIYYIIETGRDSFTVDSRISGVRTFYRMRDVD